MKSSRKGPVVERNTGLRCRDLLGDGDACFYYQLSGGERQADLSVFDKASLVQPALQRESKTAEATYTHTKSKNRKATLDLSTQKLRRNTELCQEQF